MSGCSAEGLTPNGVNAMRCRANGSRAHLWGAVPVGLLRGINLRKQRSSIEVSALCSPTPVVDGWPIIWIEHLRCSRPNSSQGSTVRCLLLPSQRSYALIRVRSHRAAVRRVHRWGHGDLMIKADPTRRASAPSHPECAISSGNATWLYRPSERHPRHEPSPHPLSARVDRLRLG